jgi:hypothetical protein
VFRCWTFPPLRYRRGRLHYRRDEETGDVTSKWERCR